MTSVAPAALPPRHLTPLDPNSAAGKAAAAGLAALFDDVVDRLRREGKAVPPELLGEDPSP